MATESTETLTFPHYKFTSAEQGAHEDISRDAGPEEILYKRRHPVWKERINQLRINILGLQGGRKYVSERLSRFPAESTIDWQGGTRSDGSAATGRLQQTHAFPYLGRINEKINQYVFSEEPLRASADNTIVRDITRDGKTVNDVMREVSSLLFSCRWCWIGVDAPTRKSDGTKYTLAEKEARKIRPYWQVYAPDQVLDWHFSETGVLEWIKTVHEKYDDSDPYTRPEPVQCVRLWQKGKYTDIVQTGKDNRGKPKYRIDEYEMTLKDRIPFIPVGEISKKPIAFDDLESINRTIMDLGSVDRANFFGRSYPQMVLPVSVIQNVIQSGYATNATEAGKLIIGEKNPVLIDKEDPAPFYMMPDAGAMATIGDRISTLKRELFEVVGLALEQESRQVASAEAKAWDFLDVSSVMRARAETLQDAEEKAVELSKAWDAGFQVWTPEYNFDFDIGDFKEEVSALIMAGNMPLPASVTREIVKKLVDRLDRLGSPIDAAIKEQVLNDIETWNPNDYGVIPPAN